MPEPRERSDLPEPSPPATVRARLRSAMTRPSRAQIVVAALLALVGFAAVTQVRTTEVDDSYSSLREQDLIDVLNGLAGTSQRAEVEISRLERTRDELTSATSSRQAALELAQGEVDTLNILAGLVPVTGPGIRITIKETIAPVTIGAMLDTVQSLRSAGAEAMQFNGQVRIIAQSAFEDGVGGLLVDGELLSPPYVIDVIGEPDTLIGSLTFTGGPQAELIRDGAEVEIEELSSLDIESVREPVEPEFAEPVS